MDESHVEADAAAAVHAFLLRYLQDRQEGRTLSLEE
jgi:hypothetical protein